MTRQHSGDVAASTKIEALTAALSDAERRIRSFVRAQRISRVGGWDWDIRTNHLEWSDGVYDVFGLEKTQFGASYDAFLASVHPDDREAVASAVSRAVTDPSATYAIEHRIIRPDGQEAVVHEAGEVRFEDGKAVFMSGTVQDVTERVLLERAVSERDQRLASVLEASASAVLGVDVYGHVTVFNAAAQATFGYSPEEIYGESIDRLIVSGARLAEIGVSSGPTGIQVTGLCSDGEAFPAEVYVSTTQDGRETVLTVLDASERSHYADRVAASRKMEAMGEMAAGIAHEFNNLLMMLSGNLELVRVTCSGDGGDLVDELITGVRRAKRLTHQLQTFVGGSELQETTIDLEPALAAFVGVAQPMLGSAFPLRLEIARQTGTIRADRRQLEQSLLNLIINARDAMPHGGTIASASTTDRGFAAFVALSARGGCHSVEREACLALQSSAGRL